MGLLWWLKDIAFQFIATRSRNVWRCWVKSFRRWWIKKEERLSPLLRESSENFASENSPLKRNKTNLDLQIDTWVKHEKQTSQPSLWTKYVKLHLWTLQKQNGPQNIYLLFPYCLFKERAQAREDVRVLQLPIKPIPWAEKLRIVVLAAN